MVLEDRCDRQCRRIRSRDRPCDECRRFASRAVAPWLGGICIDRRSPFWPVRRSARGVSVEPAFTPPLWTLRVGTGDDTVALLTFGFVAVVVGSIVSQMAQLRADAERRAHEAHQEALARVSLEADAAQARSEAEISRTRAGFISAVSHNLRTPLAAIQASSDVLIADFDVLSAEDRAAMLDNVRSETIRLRNLVEKVLEIGRIRAGGFDIAPEVVDIEGLLQAAVHRFRPLIKRRVVSVHVDDDARSCIADPIAIEQVLLNLIENVLQYTPDDSPFELVARRERGVIELQVVDHGPGIVVEQRTKVFEEFYRGDARDESRGTGLGLAIAAAFIKAHRGQLRVTETSGGGATFVARIPKSFVNE